MKMRKLLSLLLALAMLCAMLAGCGGGNNGGAGGEDGKSNAGDVSSASGARTVSMGYNADPGTLDPFSSMSAPRHWILIQLYEKLAMMNSSGELTGVLAKSWEREGTCYTITLYDYIKDSAGNPFTADDAIWCLETMMDMGTNSNLAYIDSLEKVDDYTFKMNLNSEYVGLFEAICVNTYLCTKASYDASQGMQTDPVGTGPYKLESAEMGSRYTMVKNENYWQTEDLRALDEQQQNCDTIEYRIISESAQQLIALETGVIDCLISDATTVAKYDEGGANYGSGLTVTYLPKAGNTILYLNNHPGSIFYDNPDLRKAVLYGIDSQAICEGTWGGHAAAYTTMTEVKYPDMSESWKNNEYFPFDVETSKSYLAAAGYGENELTLRLIITASNTNQSMAEIIQAYLGMCGIIVDIQPYESALFESYKSDYTQWDIIFDGKGATDYCATVIRGKLFDNVTSEGTFGFIQDSHLQELVEAACNVETHSVETVDAVLEYVEDMAYLKGIMCNEECIIYNSDKLAGISFNLDSRPAPGAFTFVGD